MIVHERHPVMAKSSVPSRQPAFHIVITLNTPKASSEQVNQCLRSYTLLRTMVMLTVSKEYRFD